MRLVFSLCGGIKSNTCLLCFLSCVSAFSSFPASEISKSSSKSSSSKNQEHNGRFTHGFEFKTLFTISLGFSHTSFKLALAGWTYSNRYHWSSISSSLYPLCVNGLIPSRRIPSSSYLCAGIGMLSKSLKSRTLLPSARLIPSCVPRSQTT